MWQLDQIKKIYAKQPAVIMDSIEKLWQLKPDLKRMMVVGAYLDGEINLGKAAELLGMHRLELQEQFLNQGIPLRLGNEDVGEAQVEVDALNRWGNQ